MASFSFSGAVTPPAPELVFRLSAPRETPKAEPLSGLVDTGADFTLIPLPWLLQVEAPEAREALVRGLWSEARPAILYLVDLHFDFGTLIGVEVIGLETSDESSGGILGRNVLNQLILLLDGPRHQLDVLERRPTKL